MDTLTHGIVGAAVAHAGLGHRLGRKAMLVGLGAGMLPDADGLIRSSADPFLRIEFHRHFTHAFVFVPFGALIAILPFLLTRWGRQHWRPIYVAALLAYLAHPPLDVVTSYGTQLFWPFSRTRVAVDWISVVDPLFTVPILLLLVWASLANRPRVAAVAVGLGLCYLALGAVQESRARGLQAEIAAARGHRIERGRVLPTLGNLIVWRSLYVANGTIHVDAVRVAWPGARSYVPGETAALVRQPPSDGAPPPAIQAQFQREFDRLWWFADGYVARSPQDPRVLGDMRYSVRTEAFEPLWGFRFQAENSSRPVDWVRVAFRGRQDGFAELWALVEGRSPRLSPEHSRRGS